MSPNRVIALCALAALATDARAEPASSAATDESSVSCGSANRGGLGRPAELALDGAHWTIPAPWRERGYRFGTDELVGMIERAGAAVAETRTGAVLGVADLSRDRGGALPNHRSHQSGRDVDLLYYAKDADGKPVAHDGGMPFYRGDGRATHTRSPSLKKIPVRWFDAAANWALVAALVADEANVERIFVSLRVYRWLVAEGEKDATAAGRERLEAMKAIVRVGKAGERHGDHMHVRIACTASDIRHGLCRPYLAPNRKNGDKWRWGIRCPR